MSIKDFYQSLGSHLNEFRDSLPQSSLESISRKLQELEDSTGKAPTRQATINSLFALSTFIDDQAAAAKLPGLSEIFNPLINKKIEEVSSAVLAEKPSPTRSEEAFARASEIDAQIQETDQLLAQAHEYRENLIASPPTDGSFVEGLMAATANISELEERCAQLLRAKAAAALPHPQKTPPSRPVACAGLRNASNKCYIHACLKGLWASRKFRAIIEHKAAALEETKKEAFAKLATAICEVPAKGRASISTKPIVVTMGEERSELYPSRHEQSAVASCAKASVEGTPTRRLTALLLHRLFLTFDSTLPVEVIEPDDKAIHDLLDEMTKYHPIIAGKKQQDSTEFLHWLFDDIFETGECLFSYVERTQRPAGLTADFCIPNIDTQGVISGNLFVIQLPDQENAVIRVQDSFEPTVVEEDIDPKSVLLSEKNQGKDHAAMAKALAAMPHKVRVQKERVFQGKPQCLFVHLWRQIKTEDVPLAAIKAELDPSIAALDLSDEALLEICGQKKGVKVQAQVIIPPEFSIHIADGSEARYRLQAVISHAGQDGAGHYYASLPAQDEAASLPPSTKRVCQQELGQAPAPPQQRPPAAASSYVLHDDDRVFNETFDKKLKTKLEQDGYILIYDTI